MARAVQVQEVKTAKRAPKAVSAPVKAAKPAKAKASAKKPTAKAKAPAKGVSYTIANRPSSGVLLFAYTQAMLNLLDMYNGAEVEKATLAKIMGQTAIAYHTTKGTMARLDNGRYTLTSVGVAFFSERATRAQSAHIEMFTTMARTGDIVGDIYKNNDQVMKIA
jgi:hypothetical protein